MTSSLIRANSLSRSFSCASLVGNSSGTAEGSSTIWQKITARAAASGRLAHHRCKVLGCPWRMLFSRADAALIAPSGMATSISLPKSSATCRCSRRAMNFLQGFAGPKNREQLVERLTALSFLQPDKHDHIAAAEIRNVCRRRGIQIGTIDALLIQLGQRYDLTLLTGAGPPIAPTLKHLCPGMRCGASSASAGESRR